MFFVQIGANIGNDGEILKLLSQGYSGLLVEPNPKSMEILKRNYQQYNLIYDSVAIANFTGKSTFYIPNDCSSHASLDLDFEFTHKHFQENIQTIEVECITLAELLEKHSIRQIDDLFIDTEGQDAKIILSTDFSKFTLQRITFEHLHTDGPHVVGRNFLEVLKHLNHYGFVHIEIGKRDTTLRRQ